MSDAIVVQDFRKTFRTPFRRRKVEAVKSVSFTVAEGDVFGFLGPNGAGKTTTIKALAGLIRPSAGAVRVLGGSPFDIAVKARVGFLPEQPYFYDYLKASELLDVFGRIFGIPAVERRRRIAELLELVGLSHAADRTLRKYSKGMQQRVGIAQALLNDPALVILDEPMSGLDPIGRKEVADIIVSLKSRGKTVFFSSHILTDIERLCDRVAILDHGVLKASGPLSDLLAGDSDEREVVLAGAGDVAAALGDVARVESAGIGMSRAVCARGRSDEVLGRALAAGFSVVSVADRRVTLEELVIGRQTLSARPAGEAP